MTDCHVEKFLHMRNVRKIYLFCRDLRAFVWRKVEPKIVLVEKKRQISGMPTTINVEDYKIIQVARDKAALGGDHLKKR